MEIEGLQDGVKIARIGCAGNGDYVLNNNGKVSAFGKQFAGKQVIVEPKDGYEFYDHCLKTEVRKKVTKKRFLVGEWEINDCYNTEAIGSRFVGSGYAESVVERFGHYRIEEREVASKSSK